MSQQDELGHGQETSPDSSQGTSGRYSTRRLGQRSASPTDDSHSRNHNTDTNASENDGVPPPPPRPPQPPPPPPAPTAVQLPTNASRSASADGHKDDDSSHHRAASTRANGAAAAAARAAATPSASSASRAGARGTGGKRSSRARSLLDELQADENAISAAAAAGEATDAAALASPNHSSSGDSGNYAFDILSNIGMDLTRRDMMSDLSGAGGQQPSVVQPSVAPMFPMLEPLPPYGAAAPSVSSSVPSNILPHHQNLDMLGYHGHGGASSLMSHGHAYGGMDSMAPPRSSAYTTPSHSAVNHGGDYHDTSRYHVSPMDSATPMGMAPHHPSQGGAAAGSSSRSGYSPAAKRRKSAHPFAPSPSPSSVGGGDDDNDAPMTWSINEHEATARIFDARMSEMYVARPGDGLAPLGNAPA